MSAITTPLFAQSLLKGTVQCSKFFAATGFMSWRIEEGATAATPVFVRISHKLKDWAKWLFRFNVLFSVLMFLAVAFNFFHGVVILEWGQEKQMLSVLCLTIIMLPFNAVTTLVPFNSECVIRECFNQLEFLGRYLKPETRLPKILSQSELVLKALVPMVFSMVLTVDVAIVALPWLPMAVTNLVETALDVQFHYPWKAISNLIDLVMYSYAGYQTAAGLFAFFLTAHCFIVCNYAVLGEFVSDTPSMVRPCFTKRYDVIIRIWRRIQVLNISVDASVGTPLLFGQNALIVQISCGTFAAIKIEGVLGIGIGLCALVCFVMLVVALRFVALLGETMSEIKAQMERECRADPLLRRQVRSLKPAFLTAGSFYFFDKSCLLTCCAIVVDNVVTCLMMARE